MTNKDFTISKDGKIFGDFGQLIISVGETYPSIKFKLELGMVDIKFFEKHICTITTPSPNIIESDFEFDIKFDAVSLKTEPFNHQSQQDGVYTIHQCKALKSQFKYHPGRRVQCLFLEGEATRYSFNPHIEDYSQSIE